MGEKSSTVDELTWLPAWRLRDAMAKGELSAVDVLDHFLGRIEEYDPVLKAFATVDANGARAQAREADAAVRRGDPIGALHGIPISVKEHIAVAGLPRRALGGRSDEIASRDDIAVERLRAVGAIVVGTNTMMGIGARYPEDAGSRPWIYPDFNWDAEARNPWDPGRTPGWSSSGGAAAAAARLLPIALGTDGGGSTRLPAAYCGVVGIHCTAGLVPSVDYDNPRIATLINSIGPLTRDVVDAAITVQAIAGPDGRDFAALSIQPPDYLARIDAGVADMRLAWTDDFGFTQMYAQAESGRVIGHVRDAAKTFLGLGATVDATDEKWEDFFFGNTVTKYLWGQNAQPSAPDWTAALDSRQRNWQAFRRVFANYDAILTTTSQLLPRRVEDWDDCWRNPGDRFPPHGTFAPIYCSHTMMQNWLGFPAVSVPCGLVDELPVGMQIIGRPGSEDKLLRIAKAFQTANPLNEHVTPRGWT